MPSMGDRCRSGGSGHARAVRGVTSPHRPAPLPDDGPVMPSEISERGAHQCPEGNCGGNTRPAAVGERTLMGPAAHLRAPKAPDPHAVRVLKRTNERKLAGWANDLAGPKRDPRRVRERRDSKLKHAADRRVGRRRAIGETSDPNGPR